MMSLQASGTFAGTLTFQDRRGTPTVYLKQKKPKRQATKAIRVRLWVRSLMQAWPGLSPADQASWEALRKHDHESLINIYLAENIKNIWEEQPVGKTPTIGPINDPGFPAPFMGIGANRHTEVIHQLAAVQDNWFHTLHRNTATPFTQGLANLVHVVEVADTDARTFVDTPLDPGDYWYKQVTYSVSNRKRVSGSIKKYVVT